MKGIKRGFGLLSLLVVLVSIGYLIREYFYHLSDYAGLSFGRKDDPTW